MIPVILLAGCSTLKGLQWPSKADQKAAVAEKKDHAKASTSTEDDKPVVEIGQNPYLKKTLSLTAEEKALFQSGSAQMRAKNWPQATKIWRELAEKVPKSSGVYLNLGICLVNQHDLTAARDAFDAGIEANKTNVFLYNWAGQVARQQGDFKQSEQYYRDGIAVWAGYSPLYLNLGILYEIYLGKLSLALEQYQKYQALQAESDPKVAKWILDLERRVVEN